MHGPRPGVTSLRPETSDDRDVRSFQRSILSAADCRGNCRKRSTSVPSVHVTFARRLPVAKLGVIHLRTYIDACQNVSSPFLCIVACL